MYPYNIVLNLIFPLTLGKERSFTMYIHNTNTVCMQGGDEDGEGGGSDIGALLGNLGPLISGLSGVSSMLKNVYMISNIV